MQACPHWPHTGEGDWDSGTNGAALDLPGCFCPVTVQGRGWESFF